MGRVLPQPVGTQLSTWLLSSDSMAAVTSAWRNRYERSMLADHTASVPENDESLQAVLGDCDEAGCMHRKSCSFSTESRDSHHSPPQPLSVAPI